MERMDGLLANVIQDVNMLTARMHVLEGKINDLDRYVRDHRHSPDPISQNEISTLSLRVSEISQHLEDLHYDLERGDVGNLVEVLKEKLYLEYGWGERSEPNKEDDDK